MAKYWTYLEIKNKIQNDTDTEAENFIQPSELLALVNEAIDEAESYIHTLGLEDDYFLTYEDKSITAGDETIDLPTDIYAHKIRHIMYRKNNLIYPVRRIRGMNKFEHIENALYFTNAGDYYRYTILNLGTDGNATPAPKIMLIPVAQATETSTFRIWYIRNVKELVEDTDICDIPEFVHFVIKQVKFAIYMKEGHPNVAAAKAELEQERKRMVDTLSTMIPDTDSTIVPDLTSYSDQTALDTNYY